MPRGHEESTLSPGQAQYVIDRLLVERRIAPAEIARYLGEMGREIADIEARLARLRAAGAPPRSAVLAEVQRGRRAPIRTREVQARGAKTRRGNPVAGSYMGFMRQVRDERKKAEFRKLKETQGYERAIAAIKQHLGK